MLTVHPSSDLVRRLARADARRGIGIGIDQFITESLTAALDEPHHDNMPRRVGFVAIGAFDQTRGAAEADELLAEGFGPH